MSKGLEITEHEGKDWAQSSVGGCWVGPRLATWSSGVLCSASMMPLGKDWRDWGEVGEGGWCPSQDG